MSIASGALLGEHNFSANGSYFNNREDDGKMKKRMAMWSLADGVDDETIWKYFSGAHGPAFAQAAGAGLIKYSINRVKQVVSGKQKFYVLSELWYENEAAMLQALETAKVTTAPSGKTLFGDLKGQTADSCVVLVEERVIKE